MQDNNSSLNGVFIIDKPAGPSSAKIVSIVKRSLKAKKAGHAGTLDPFATGLLILCINKATKLARFCLDSSKAYQAELFLGVETDTQDPTGKVISSCDNINFSEDTIESVIKSFKGKIDQVPPAFSALKHEGVPLYKLARKGEPFQKPSRQIQIHEIEVQKIELPSVFFEVRCSSGTYVRTLCSDIGKKLGCGAHLRNLRRISSGSFTIEDAITLSEFEDLAQTGNVGKNLIGMAEALTGITSFQADKSLTDKIKYGIMIKSEDIPLSSLFTEEKLLKIVDENNSLLSVLRYDPFECSFKYCCSFM